MAWKVMLLRNNGSNGHTFKTEHDIEDEEVAIALAKHWTKQKDEEDRINPNQIAFVLEDHEEDAFGLDFNKNQKFVRTIINGHDCNPSVRSV